MNKLFLQYIQEKQKNNFEIISFKNSMRKNCWQKPLSIVESEVASTEVISAPPVNTTPNLFPNWWKGFPFSNPNQAPPVWIPGGGPIFGPMDEPAKPIWDITPSGLGGVFSGKGNYDDIAPDADGDGIPDYRDPDYNYPVPNYGPLDPDSDQDSDGDGLNDVYDNDMDNDGLPDDENDEYPGDDYDNDGLPDEPADGAWEDYDNDGIPNAYEDDDDDGEPNYRDPDSPFYGDQDTDNDGIADPFDPYPMDYDNDGWPSLYDRDADGNGILDDEQGVFPDRDDDGIRDSEDEDTQYDQDGDEIPDNEDQYPYDPFNGQNPQGL